MLALFEYKKIKMVKQSPYFRERIITHRTKKKTMRK